MSCSDPAIRAKIIAYANQYGINPAVALAQINQESGCNPNVCSYKGACGIAQFLPGTWAQYGSGSRSDVDAALDAWGRLMRDLLSRFNGDYRLALAGYHSGPGAAAAALRNPAGNPRTNNYVNSILAGIGSIFDGGTAAAGSGSPADASSSLDLSPVLVIGGLVALWLILK